MKSVGPSILTWGMPVATGYWREVCMLRTTHSEMSTCFGRVKEDGNHFETPKVIDPTPRSIETKNMTIFQIQFIGILFDEL